MAIARAMMAESEQGVVPAVTAAARADPRQGRGPLRPTDC